MRINSKQLKRAFYKAEMLELAAFESLQIIEPECSPEHLAAMERLLGVERPRPHAHVNWKKVLIAAIAAALITSALSLTVYGKEIIGFITQFYEDHIRFTTDDTTGVIETEFAPTWIPEGYTKISVNKSPVSIRTTWENDTNSIILSQLTSGSRHNVDNKDTGYYTMNVDGMTVHCISKHNTHVFMWTDGSYSFELYFSSYISDEYAARIIRSVSPLE